MKHFLLYILILISSSAFSTTRKIDAFFNHYEKASYEEPYRDKIRRGHNLEEIMIRAIDNAQYSISIAVQELRLPLLAKAIVKKHRQGVDVRIVVEDKYNHTIRTALGSINQDDSSEEEEHEATRYSDLFAFIDQNQDGKITTEEMAQRDAMYILKKAGVRIIDDTYDSSLGSGIMHHKFMVIDDELVIVTSANFTMSGVHGDTHSEQSKGNANALIRIYSKELANVFNEEFDYMWGSHYFKSASVFGINKPFRPVRQVSVGSSSIKVKFSPTSRTLPWSLSVNGFIADEISSVRKSALMALFVFSDQKISKILNQVYSKHLVQIGLLIEPMFAYRNYSELLDLWGLAMLDENCQYEQGNFPWSNPIQNAGVPTLARGDMLHHKFAVLDSKKVIIGSQNWSNAANHTNDENVVVIENERIAKLFEQEFQRLNRNSRLGPTSTVHRRINLAQRRCR